MAMEFTERQKEAISADGSVIVYAAAGSGKTAVLTERVVRRLLDEKNPIDADKFLIVTFTNAAAAEMRTRISSLLTEKAGDNPSEHAHHQLSLISAAPICTIDSFCINIVRENFELAGVSPDFKMASGSVTTPISEGIIRTMVAERELKGDKNFKILTDSIGVDASLRGFIEVITGIYNSSRSLPNPHKWLKESAEKYNSDDGFWYKKLYELSKKTVRSIKADINTMVITAKESPQVFAIWATVFEEFNAKLDLIEDALQKEDYDGAKTALEPLSLASLGRKATDDKIFNDYYKSTREKVNKKLDKLRKFFSKTKEESDRLLEKEGAVVAALVDFVIEYGERFRAEMIEKNYLTFDMAEHMAFELICQTDEKGDFVPTEIGKALSEKYREVLVDEYQDNNSLQDALFMAVSGGGKHLFMVGDAKQSIYGFRHANPRNFIRYREEYPEYREGAEKNKVVLDANFRSRKNICDFTNDLFSLIMNKEVSEMDYTEDDQMKASLDYKEFGEPSVEYHLIERNKQIVAEAEAEHIVEYIRSTMEREAFLGRVEDKEPRRAKYGDFCILLRSAVSKGGPYMKALKKAGIPVQFQSEEFTNTTEIMSVLSLLRAVDNPTDSVSLLASATGPIFALSPEEIAKAKVNHPSETLYGSLLLAAENGQEGIKRFVKEIKELRKKSVLTSVTDLVQYIYDKYSVIEVMSSADEGERRAENLLAFLSVCADFEADNPAGLSAFLRFASNGDTIQKPKAEGYSGDSVKIMTIHGSKGLQFPICILANCAGEFIKLDSRANVKKHEACGISVNLCDIKTHKKEVPISSYILENEITMGMLAEEQRLLYVATTRAAEKMIFLITKNDVKKRIETPTVTLEEIKNQKLDSETILKANCYSDWLFDEVEMKGGKYTENKDIDCGSFVIRYFPYIEESEEQQGKSQEVFADEKLSAMLSERFDYQYPHGESSVTKTTVSEILANENYEYEFTRRPAVVQKGGLSPAEKGTALHKFMQFADFGLARENTEEEISRLLDWEYISEREAESLDRAKINKFLESNLCDRILASPILLKEQNFLVPLKDGGDTLIQGSVDCVFGDDEGLYVVDFKTTRYNTEDEFIKAYRRQTEIYAEAIEEILGIRVKGQYIYSLHLGKSIEVK